VLGTLDPMKSGINHSVFSAFFKHIESVINQTITETQMYTVEERELLVEEIMFGIKNGRGSALSKFHPGWQPSE